MSYQSVFKRYELKYLLTEDQKKKLLEEMEPYMEPDCYGRTTISSIYFDTEDYRLIRRSIEKPAYKEKLRVRSYGKAEADSTVFVELKKKYDHVVYKRRIPLPEKEAMEWVTGKKHCSADTQISEEVDYFLTYYRNLRPSALLSYEREAFCSKDGSDFRVTFDDTILYREEDLSLEAEVYGEPILPDGMVLMELKCPGAIPLWMAHVLSREKIYRTSFSKYGTAYSKGIFPQIMKEELRHA